MAYSSTGSWGRHIINSHNSVGEKGICVLKVWFELPLPSQCREITENENMCFIFPKLISAQKDLNDRKTIFNALRFAKANIHRQHLF